MPAVAVTVSATFSAVPYTITYVNAADGTHDIENENTTTYTVADAVTLAAPTESRDDLTFLGWYSDAAFTTEATGIDKGATGEKTFYAKWKISYVGADGQAVTRDGFTFLEGGETSLAAGWYVADGTISYSDTIMMGAGSYHIILADNCQMNIGSSASPLNLRNQRGLGYDSNDKPALALYGQSAGSGALNVYTSGNNGHAILAGSITVNGGRITTRTTGDDTSGLRTGGGDVTVNGGTVDAEAKGKNYYSCGIYANGNFHFNGGQVAASGTYAGIFAMANASGAISLGWKNPGDSIEASSYKLYNSNATLTVANGKYLRGSDGGFYSGDITNKISDLAGVTLKPANIIVSASQHGSVAPGYTVDGSEPAPNPYCAPAGTEVTLTAAPAAGYKTGEVRYNDGTDHTITPDENGKYQFTMPAGNVTVTAAFISPWGQLQEQLDSASKVSDAPTVITLDGNVTADESDKYLFVRSDTYVVLDLNGHRLDRNLQAQASNGNAILVSGNLTVRDGSSARAGVITGGYASSGGGVDVLAGGTFTLESGSVTGNHATAGGGVHLAGGNNNEPGGTFILSGGEVSGNTARVGGGVYVFDGGTFSLSGNPTVKDNKGNKDGSAVDDNVWLHHNTITVTGALANTAHIGVRMFGGSGVFTSGYSGGGTGDDTYTNTGAPAKYFTSDDGDYIVRLVNGEATI